MTRETTNEVSEIANEKQAIKDAARLTKAVAGLLAAMRTVGAGGLQINRGILCWYASQNNVTHMCDLEVCGIEFPQDTFMEFEPKPVVDYSKPLAIRGPNVLG